MGVSLSGGIIDWTLYGIVPSIAGFHTRFWTVLIVGPILAAIYYPVFYLWIVQKDIKTPGRGEVQIGLITKKEYKDAKAGEANSEYKIEELAELLGGTENIISSQNCATRLRLTLKDDQFVKTNETQIKQITHGVGIAYVGKGSVQIIIGAKAELFNTKLNRYMKENKN